eukprot:tig00000704_g3361.t1
MAREVLADGLVALARGDLPAAASLIPPPPTASPPASPRGPLLATRLPAQRLAHGLALQRARALRETRAETAVEELADALHAAGELRLAQGSYREADELLLRALSLREASIGVRPPRPRPSPPSRPPPTPPPPPLLLLLRRTRCPIRGASIGPPWPPPASSPSPPPPLLLLLRASSSPHAPRGRWCTRPPPLLLLLLVVHTDVAATLCALAALRVALWRPADAEGLYKRAVTVREAVFGEGHEAVAQPADALARLYVLWARYPEADQLSARALALREANLPKGHPGVAAALDTRAWVRLQMGKYDEADHLYQVPFPGPAQASQALCITIIDLEIPMVLEIV